MADLSSEAYGRLITALGTTHAKEVRDILNKVEEFSQAEVDALEALVVGHLSEVVADVTLAAAQGGANVCEVTLTAKDYLGDTLAAVTHFDVWLSDAATGAGLTGTAASGTVTAKAESGSVIDTYTAKKALRVQTLATGIFILEITDSGATAFNVCVSVPGTGKTAVLTLAAGDYGS